MKLLHSPLPWKVLGAFIFSPGSYGRETKILSASNFKVVTNQDRANAEWAALCVNWIGSYSKEELESMGSLGEVMNAATRDHNQLTNQLYELGIKPE